MKSSSYSDRDNFHIDDIRRTQERLLTTPTSGCPMKALRAKISANASDVYKDQVGYNRLLEKGIPKFFIKLMLWKESFGFRSHVKSTLNGKLDRKKFYEERVGTVEFVRWHQKLMDNLDQKNLLNLSQNLPPLSSSIDISGTFDEATHCEYLTSLSKHTHAEHIWNVYQELGSHGIIDANLSKKDLLATMMDENFLKAQNDPNLNFLHANIHQFQTVLEHVIGMAVYVEKEFPGAPEKQKAILKRSLWWITRVAMDQPNHWKPYTMTQSGIFQDTDIREEIGYGSRRMPFLNPAAIQKDPKGKMLTLKPEFFSPGDEYAKERNSPPFHAGCAGIHMELKNGKNIVQHLTDEVIEVVYKNYFSKTTSPEGKTNPQ